MPDHGFGGVDHHVLGCFSKGALDRSGLEQVIVMGAGSVGVDVIYLRRLDLAFFYSKGHGFGRPASIFRRGGDVVGISRCPVAC